MAADYRNYQNGTARHRNDQDGKQVSSSQKLSRVNKTVAHRNVRAAAYRKCLGLITSQQVSEISGLIKSHQLTKDIGMEHRTTAYQNCQGGAKDSRSLVKSGFISSLQLVENVE
jgi:uncharacterized protein (DUF1015 family)